MTIRPYNPSDLERCRALWAELTQHHRDIYEDPTIGGDAPGLHFDQHLARARPERLWVADCAGVVVGLVGLIPGDEGAEVEPLVVTATHRGRGMGRALLAHVVNEARHRGVRYLSVRPVARNAGAISFFHDAGFRTLGHIELFMELGPEASDAWQPGPTLFGHSFDYRVGS